MSQRHANEIDLLKRKVATLEERIQSLEAVLLAKPGRPSKELREFKQEHGKAN